MAESVEEGDTTVIADNPIADLLAAQLRPDWTLEGLAEQLICTMASCPIDEVHEFVLDAEATEDHQTRRLLRPLLAYLATKSAAEAGSAVNIYVGDLSFERPGNEGPVWVLAHFENKPGAVRAVFRRSTSPRPDSEQQTLQLPTITGGGSRLDAPLVSNVKTC